VPPLLCESTQLAAHRGFRESIMNGSNPLGGGDPTFCDDCEKPYHEIQRLPGQVGLCPTCFERAMGA